MNQHYITALDLLRDRIEDEQSYPFHLPVVRFLEKIEFHPKVTFLIGENGTGKSTLLEAIALNYGFNPEGGSKNFNFSTYASHSALWEYIRLAKGIKKPKDAYFLRAESFYNVATNIEQLDQEGMGPPIKSYYGDKSLHEQSHGESFFSLFLHRLYGEGMYLLDEPESALSPQRQLAFLTRMHQLITQNSQFIISTHSPIIMAYPDAKIIQISEQGLEEVNYKQTDHYAVYKSFINDPEHMIQLLGIDKHL